MEQVDLRVNELCIWVTLEMRCNLNLDKEKTRIKNLLNKQVRLKVNIGRNKFEYYNGVIEGMYDSVFTVSVNGIIKSFSYADLLTKNVLIKKSI